MNHRKKEHPSDKLCRYFKDGKCSFSASECWYAHGNQAQAKVFPNAENADFREATKNLPPDMKQVIDQLIKISAKALN